MIVFSLCPTSRLVNLDTANERVVRHRGERNHELPARIRPCRELVDVGDVLYPRRREAGPIPASSHRVCEDGFIARATEESEAALPGYNIPSSSFAGGCSGRDHSVRTFLNLPRNYLNDCYELTITIYIVIKTSYHC
jgi:hypothetical protein